MSKIMNHAEYVKKVKRLPVESLRFIVKDAQEAIAAMPDGENVGYYLDEISYAATELKDREERERRQARRTKRNGRYGF